MNSQKKQNINNKFKQKMKTIFIINRGNKPVLAFESMESAINAKIQLEQEIGKIYTINETEFIYD